MTELEASAVVDIAYQLEWIVSRLQRNERLGQFDFLSRSRVAQILDCICEDIYRDLIPNTWSAR